MFFKIRGRFSQIPALFRIVLLLSLFFLVSGGISNGLVRVANDGKMPVGVQSADMLFVIGPAKFGVTVFPPEDSFDDRHQALTDQTKLRILADRIPITLRFVDKEKLPHWGKLVLDWTAPPIGKEWIASPGDLCVWSGLLLSYINLPLYLLWLLWLLGKNFLRGHPKT